MKYKLPKVKAKRMLRNRVESIPGKLCGLLNSLSNLSGLGFSIAVCVVSTLASAQESITTSPTTGQEIVAHAAERMLLHPSLEAKMRQRVGIRDQYMVGSGAYLQLRHGEDVRFRLELRLPVGDRLTSLQHITDNRYLYIRRDFGEEKLVSRIDLKRVQEAKTSSDVNGIKHSYASLGAGGLSQLLHGLARNFEFEAPASETISGVNVWRLEGHWKREVLAKLFPEQAEQILAGEEAAIDKLPPQLPHRVSLVVGRDGPLPLFPYRVEFSRQEPDEGKPHPMMIMELFEVRLRPDLDPRLFEVPDSEQDLVDETDAYLRKNGLVEDDTSEP